MKKLRVELGACAALVHERDIRLDGEKNGRMGRGQNVEGRMGQNGAEWGRKGVAVHNLGFCTLVSRPDRERGQRSLVWNEMWMWGCR